MTEVIHNQRGGTKENACPTRLGQWFDDPFCSAGDVKAWKVAASNLYTRGLLPRYEQLRAIDTARNDWAASGFAYALLEQYRANFERLGSASIFDPDDNAKLVADVVALMESGSTALDMLTARITEAKQTPVAIAYSETVPVVTSKPAWSRWAPLAAAAAGVGAFLTLVVTAGGRPTKAREPA